MSRQVLLRWQAEAIANLNGVAVSLDGRIHPVQAGAPGHSTAEGAHIANDREGVEGMNIIPDAEHRAAVIDGLRRLATFLDDHPDVPIGGSEGMRLSYPADLYSDGGDADHRAEVERIASVLDAVPRDSGGHYIVRKMFGPVGYEAYAIPAESMRRHRALMTYNNNVTPEAAS